MCAMTVNRLTVCLMVLSLLLIAGCILIPTRHSGYTIGKVIGDEDLAFIELGVTTKSEVVERLGENYIFVEEDNVFYYYWITNHGTDFLFIGVGAGAAMIDGFTYKNLENGSVYVKFDSDGHVKKLGKLKGKDFTTAQKEWREPE